MQNLRKWLATVVVGFAVGMATYGLQAANQVAIDPGWRFTDGYWNYYHPTDRAWYYTDGRNWYTYGNNNAWSVYGFDRDFGRNAFVREGYVVPKPGPDIVVPRHRVFIPGR